MKNNQFQKEEKQTATTNQSEVSKQSTKESLHVIQKQVKDTPVYKRYSFNGTAGGYQGL